MMKVKDYADERLAKGEITPAEHARIMADLDASEKDRKSEKYIFYAAAGLFFCVVSFMIYLMGDILGAIGVATSICGALMGILGIVYSFVGGERP